MNRRLSNQHRVRDALPLLRLTAEQEAQHAVKNAEQAHLLRAELARLTAEGREE